MSFSQVEELFDSGDFCAQDTRTKENMLVKINVNVFFKKINY